MGFFFLDSLMPTPKPEEENRSSDEALSDSRHSGLACSKATHIPTSPGCFMQFTTVGKTKSQNSHLEETLEPHKCVIYTETGAARHHSQALHQDRNPAAFPHSHGHDGNME